MQFKILVGFTGIWGGVFKTSDLRMGVSWSGRGSSWTIFMIRSGWNAVTLVSSVWRRIGSGNSGEVSKLLVSFETGAMRGGCDWGGDGTRMTGSLIIERLTSERKGGWIILASPKPATIFFALGRVYVIVRSAGWIRDVSSSVSSNREGRTINRSLSTRTLSRAIFYLGVLWHK